MDGVSLKAMAYSSLSQQCIDSTLTSQGLEYDWYLFDVKFKCLDIGRNY